MAMSYPVESIYHSLCWGELWTTCSNVTEVAPWAAPSCCRPQPAPAPNNYVRDGRSNWLAVYPQIHLNGTYAGHKSQDLLQPVGRERLTFWMPGHRTASEATEAAQANHEKQNKFSI